MSLRFAATALAIAAVAALPTTAQAHEEIRVPPVGAELGHFRSALEKRPNAKGLEAALIDGRIPALFVRNETGRVLRVPGLHDEPFLRIGPGGVRANTRSPTYYRAGVQAIRRVPPEAQPRSRPRWTTLSPQPAWGWLELRGRVAGRGQHAFALGPRIRTVHRWTTPIRLGSRTLALSGRVDWVPAPAARHDAMGDRVDRPLTGWLIPAVTAGGAGLALAVFSRRRRATGPYSRGAVRPPSVR